MVMACSNLVGSCGGLFLVTVYIVGSCFSSTAHPKGHLEPLGFHRDADYEIDEFSDPTALTPKRFFEEYVAAGRPVFYRGFAKEFGAFSRWTVDGLNTSYGPLAVRVEHLTPSKAYHGQIEGEYGLGRDSVASFLSKIRAPVSHAVSELPTQMYSDIALLPSVSCGNLAQHIVRALLNMDTGGVRTGLEKRPLHSVHCQLNGSQDWILMPTQKSDHMYWKPDEAVQGRVPSAIDVDAIDLERFPLFVDVPWGLASLEPGDCLYIPAHHPYQVRSYGMLNMNVAVLFSDIDTKVPFDGSSCKGGKPEFVPLERVKESILWTYPGEGLLSLSRPDRATMIKKIKSLSKDGQPMKKDFLHLLEVDDIESEEYNERKREVEKAFELLKRSGSANVLTDEDLSLVDQQTWRDVSFLLEPEDDVSMAPDHEFAVLSFNLIRAILVRALTHNERLDREDFLDVYQKILQGSAFIGNKLFDRFDKNKNGIITTKLLQKKRLEKGLRDFLLSGDETETEEDVESPSYLTTLLVGSEEAIEKDPKLSPTEKTAAQEAVQEKSHLLQGLLGISEGEEDEAHIDEEDDEVDRQYRREMERIKKEKLEEEYEFNPEGLEKHVDEEERQASGDSSTDESRPEEEGTRTSKKSNPENEETARDEL